MLDKLADSFETVAPAADFWSLRLVDETSDCRPESENGQDCLAAEEILWEHSRSVKSDVKHSASVLRLAGIYGPGRLLRRIEQVRAGEPVAGNPEGFLNLIHVDDAVQAVLASALPSSSRTWT